MSAVAVWLDSEHAKIFRFSAKGIEKKELKKHSHKHSNSHQDKHNHSDEEHFFHEVAQTIGSTEELLILGPGMAKTHFKTHLEKHHHEQLAKVVVGVESMDVHLTENEVVAHARKFFKKFNLFNTNL